MAGFRGITDRQALKRFLARSPPAHLYELGFLDEPAWTETRWWGWETTPGELAVVAAVFPVGDIPGVMVHANAVADDAGAFLKALLDVLPATFYGEFAASWLPHLEARLDLSRSTGAIKMSLTRPE